MKKIVVVSLISFLYLITLCAGGTPSKVYKSWQAYWQYELRKVDKKRQENLFSDARAGYIHIANSADTTIPESVRHQAVARLKDMQIKNEPLYNVFVDSPERREMFKVGESLEDMLKQADELRSNGMYTQAAEIYRELREKFKPPYHYISGLAHVRLEEMIRVGQH